MYWVSNSYKAASGWVVENSTSADSVVAILSSSENPELATLKEMEMERGETKGKVMILKEGKCQNDDKCNKVMWCDL